MNIVGASCFSIFAYCPCDCCDTEASDTTPLLRPQDLLQIEEQNNALNEEPLADAYRMDNYKTVRDWMLRASYWWELLNFSSSVLDVVGRWEKLTKSHSSFSGETFNLYFLIFISARLLILNSIILQPEHNA